MVERLQRLYLALVERDVALACMKTRHLAMWSGPRNISTAMMRAWENRGDCEVIDEPLYAHYLAHTGLDHPGREASHRCRGDRLAQGCRAPHRPSYLQVLP